MTDVKPVVEFGLTDSCCSLAWFQSSTTLAEEISEKLQTTDHLHVKIAVIIMLEEALKYDTSELERELKKLRTVHNQRGADSVDDPQPFKKRKRWQFHSKWKRKRNKDLNSEQETAESYSLKRPRGSDPNDTEEESPDLVIQTAKDVPNESNSTSIPSTKTFFPIFSRKPLIFFNATPPKFSAEPKANEVKDPPKKKAKPKAKKPKPKTGKETTNTITNYFGASAAANNNNTSNPP